MPTIDGKEYPRLENGVVIEKPPAPRRSIPKPVGPDINSASVGDLKKISGVGQKVAKAIVAERENGPFANLADCADRVSGVTTKSLEAAGAFAGSEE